MPNPTGTTYLAANTKYAWADGDIYEIPQTDSVEGAAAGASFGGLGVANQPHQLLLDKIQQIREKQLLDEATLADFPSLVTSDVGTTGWLKFSVGSAQPILQWGTFPLVWITHGVISSPVRPVTFSFATPFSTSVWWVNAWWLWTKPANQLGINKVLNYISLQTILPLQLNTNQLTWQPPDTIPTIAGGGQGFSAVSWIALGE